MSSNSKFVRNSIVLGVLTIILNLLLLVAMLGIVGMVVWFFLVEAGTVPPMDYVPFIPNV